jgi:hypothetical protein
MKLAELRALLENVEVYCNGLEWDIDKVDVSIWGEHGEPKKIEIKKEGSNTILKVDLT